MLLHPSRKTRSGCSETVNESVLVGHKMKDKQQKKDKQTFPGPCPRVKNCRARRIVYN